MKNKLITLALFLVAFVTYSCNDEFEEPNSFSDIAFYTSDFRTTTTLEVDGEIKDVMFLGAGKYISFSDLSHGEVEHKWTIPSDANFLEGKWNRNTKDYKPFIKDTQDTTSTEETVHVYFGEGHPEGGLYEVNLRNTFSDSVSFRGVDTLESVYQGGQWVIDTTFLIKVFDTIQVAVEVRQEGNLIDLENTDTIFVEAGDVLEFTDLTTIGEPDTRTWEIGNDTYSGEQATVTFKKLGVGYVFFSASRTELNIPPDFERYRIPVPIKVIPSSKPFELFADLTELENETIQIPFNGEFIPFVEADAIDLFTVLVNGEEFTVESLKINSADATILDLKLSEPIYRPDNITISYAGGLESTDTRQSEAFTDEPVVMHDVNLFDAVAFGFEDPNQTAWNPMWDNKSTVEYSTEQAASGNYSLKLSVAEGGDAKVHSDGAMFSLEAGKTYIFRYKLWIDPAIGGGSISPFFLPAWKQFWQGFDGKARGEWVTVEEEREFKPGSATDEARFMFRMLTVGTVYIDDLYMVEKEVRPTVAP